MIDFVATLYEWRMHKQCNFVPNDRIENEAKYFFLFETCPIHTQASMESRMLKCRPAEMRNIFICVNNLQNYRLNQQPAIQHHVNYIWINRKCQYQILHRMLAGTRHPPPCPLWYGSGSNTMLMYTWNGGGIRDSGLEWPQIGDEINIMRMCRQCWVYGLKIETISVLITNGCWEGKQRRAGEEEGGRIGHTQNTVWYPDWRDTLDTHQKTDRMKCLRSLRTATSNHGRTCGFSLSPHCAMHGCKSIYMHTAIWILRVRLARARSKIHLND